MIGQNFWGWMCSAFLAVLKNRGITVKVNIPTGYTKKSELILVRDTFTDLSTTGCMLLEGEHLCYTLEPSCRKQVGKYLAIPQGSYEILLEWSTRFQMDTPHLQNIPGRTFIEIHPGNTTSNTEGCILVGISRDVDYVGSSRDAFNELMKKIQDKLKEGKLFISITGGGKSV